MVIFKHVRIFKASCLMLLLLMVTSLSAEAVEAYANFTSTDGTLTFYYDDLRSSRSGKTYALNTGSVDPAWSSIYASVQQVVFDASFADARPTSTKSWFFKMSKIKTDYF